MPYNYGIYQAKKMEARNRNEDLRNDENVGISAFFGATYIDDRTNTLMGDQATLKHGYEDFVSRELGISREVINNNRILKGLANPGDYLYEKNVHLQQIGVKCSDYYSSEYIKLINYGFSMEEAKHKALVAANHEKERLMREHLLEFPENLTNSVKNKLHKRNMVNDF